MTIEEATAEIDRWRARARKEKNEYQEYSYDWQLLNTEICAYNDVIHLLKGDEI